MFNNVLHNSQLEVLRIIILIALIPIALFLSKVAHKLIAKKYSPQMGMVAQKGIFYLLTVLILSVILNQLGFKLNAILGAAGIAGIAVGFASQTSLSNIISGLFLIGEKPFQVGDVIRSGDVTGIVMSIDLLSVKVKTFDNQFIRIPNESLIKSNLTTITKYPIRRMDINVSVAYKSNLKLVLEVLQDVAEKNTFALVEPEPLILIKDYGDSSINILLGLWFSKTDFLKLKNSIMIEIKEAFDKNEIEIPFPQRTIHVLNE